MQLRVIPIVVCGDDGCDGEFKSNQGLWDAGSHDAPLRSSTSKISRANPSRKPRKFVGEHMTGDGTAAGSELLIPELLEVVELWSSVSDMSSCAGLGAVGQPVDDDDLMAAVDSPRSARSCSCVRPEKNSMVQGWVSRTEPGRSKWVQEPRDANPNNKQCTTSKQGEKMVPCVIEEGEEVQQFEFDQARVQTLVLSPVASHTVGSCTSTLAHV